MGRMGLRVWGGEIRDPYRSQAQRGVQKIVWKMMECDCRLNVVKIKPVTGAELVKRFCIERL